MSSLVFRVCRSIKNCTKCEKTISKGEEYYGGSYKSLCVECFKNEKLNRLRKDDLKKDAVIITGKCAFCEKDAEAFVCLKKICNEHINQALVEGL